MIERMNDIAAKISKDYLRTGADPNKTLRQYVERGDIENKEVYARICEKINNNIYLSLFNANTERSAISFPTAKKELYNKFEEGDPVYNSIPKNYKDDFIDKTAAPVGRTENDRLRDMDALIEHRSKLAHLIESVHTMCHSEIKNMEKHAQSISKVARDLTTQQQSVADYAALSGRVVEHECGLNPVFAQEKFAQAVGDISERGIRVNMEFTKTASATPDVKSSIYNAPIEYSNSNAKLAALAEIGNGLLNQLDSIDAVLQDERLQ